MAPIIASAVLLLSPLLVTGMTATAQYTLRTSGAERKADQPLVDDEQVQNANIEAYIREVIADEDAQISAKATEAAAEDKKIQEARQARDRAIEQVQAQAAAINEQAKAEAQQVLKSTIQNVILEAEQSASQLGEKKQLTENQRQLAQTLEEREQQSSANATESQALADLHAQLTNISAEAVSEFDSLSAQQLLSAQQGQAAAEALGTAATAARSEAGESASNATAMWAARSLTDANAFAKFVSAASGIVRGVAENPLDAPGRS